MGTNPGTGNTHTPHATHTHTPTQITRIIGNTRPDRQTVMFSATFPMQIEGLARKVLGKNAIEIVVGGRSVAAGEIDQHVEVRTAEQQWNSSGAAAQQRLSG